MSRTFSRSLLLLAVVSATLSWMLPSELRAEQFGTLSCKVDGAEWKDSKTAAFQTGENTLSIGTDNDKVEGMLIMISRKPAVGDLPFNDGAMASYADEQGANFNSNHGSGKLTISKFKAPDGETPGLVEGGFSGTFGPESGKKRIFSDCKFSAPVTTK